METSIIYIQIQISHWKLLSQGYIKDNKPLGYIRYLQILKKKIKKIVKLQLIMMWKHIVHHGIHICHMDLIVICFYPRLKIVIEYILFM